MNDPVFLDSAAFLRVWQRVTGEAGITAAPEQPETDPLTAQLRGCICAKAAGTAFYAALALRRSAHSSERCKQSIFCARARSALRLPPVRGRARRRRICAASIGRSLRSARSWMRQPMLR